jgi:hypothetical protein
MSHTAGDAVYAADVSDTIVARTLAEVRYHNTHSRLYPDPTDPARKYALRVMRFAGLVELCPATRTSWGGWFELPCDTVHA